MTLPVWRARLVAKPSTTLYLDATTGRLSEALDDTERANRWIRVGLHDFDFPGLRARPVWDIVVLLLLAGVTATCAIGA